MTNSYFSGGASEGHRMQERWIEDYLCLGILTDLISACVLAPVLTYDDLVLSSHHCYQSILDMINSCEATIVTMSYPCFVHNNVVLLRVTRKSFWNKPYHPTLYRKTAHVGSGKGGSPLLILGQSPHLQSSCVRKKLISKIKTLQNARGKFYGI